MSCMYVNKAIVIVQDRDLRRALDQFTAEAVRALASVKSRSLHRDNVGLGEVDIRESGFLFWKRWIISGSVIDRVEPRSRRK